MFKKSLTGLTWGLACALALMVLFAHLVRTGMPMMLSWLSATGAPVEFAFLLPGLCACIVPSVWRGLTYEPAAWSPAAASTPTQPA